MNGARAIFKNKQRHLGSPGTPQKTGISWGDGLLLRVINGTVVRTVLTFCGTACFWRQSRVCGIWLDWYRGGKSVGYTFKTTSHESTVQTCEGSMQLIILFSLISPCSKLSPEVWYGYGCILQAISQLQGQCLLPVLRVEWKEHAFSLSPGTINIS